MEVKYTFQVPWVMYFQNIYAYGGQSPKPMEWLLVFHVSSGGRRPLEMKDTYPSTLGDVPSEYIWLTGSISKTLGVVACFYMPLQEGDALGRSPLEMKYAKPSILGDVLSEYM